MYKNLSGEEMVEMLALLLMSCKSSIVRVNDKRKETYYGKPHQFTDKYAMLSEIIHKRGFLQSWIQQYIQYREHNMNLKHRPTLGRINNDNGYMLDNIEAQGYGENTAQMMVERCSQPCVTLVASRRDGTALLIESPSVTNTIARINEVMELALTRGSLKGKIKSGLTRLDSNYSIFIVSRDKLLEEPIVVDMSVTMYNIIDDASVRLVVLPEISEAGCSQVRLQIDDIGIIYVNFVEEAMGYDSNEMKKTDVKEEIMI